MNTYKIKRLKFSDIEALASLEASLFNHAWTQEQFLSAINSSHYLVYGIKKDNILVSYICIRSFLEIGKFAKDEIGEFEILNIATSKEYQQQGHANSLLSFIIKLSIKLHIESIFLDVRVTNISALALYAKHEFKEISRRKNYFTTNSGKEDAIIMQWINKN